MDEVAEHVRRLEEQTGKRFGDSDDPLLVSVRSGAAISMPGMMDTILNLGLGDAAAEGLAARTGNRRFALDSYRRLIQMFGEVVEGIDGQRFEDALDALKRERGAALDTDLTADDLDALLETYRAIYREAKGEEFPQDATRAAAARRAGRLRLVGHAARARLPQGERDPRRHRHRGQRRADGLRQQGRPLGHRRRVHARPVDRRERRRWASSSRTRRARTSSRASARRSRSRRWATCCRAPTTSCWRRCSQLERHYRDAQDVEFTVEDDRLYLLQTRAAKRTAAGRARRSPSSMVDEGLISREEALARIDPGQLDQLLHPMIDPAHVPEEVARGLNASPGAASGGIVFDADTAVERAKDGPVILVRIRDDARRHPRDDRRRGDPHRPRRHDLARGRRRARDGQAVRRRLRRRSCSTTASRASPATSCTRATRSRSTAAPARSSSAPCRSSSRS